MPQAKLAEKIDFNQEAVFIEQGFASQEMGPVSSFKPENKAETKKIALETGHIYGDFQYCGPFSDSQAKTIRQELVTTRNLINIFGDKLVTPDIESLPPQDLALRLFADRVVNEAVLVEGARRAALAVRGEGSDDIDFCKQEMNYAMEQIYPAPQRELALSALGLFHTRLENLMNDDKSRGLAEETLAKYPFLAEAGGRQPEVLKPQVQAEVKAYLDSRFAEPFAQVRQEIGEINNDNMTQAVKSLMRLLGFLDQGWAVQFVGDARVGFYVDPTGKKVEVGNRTKEITWPAFEKLMIHEVGVHVTRAANAYSSGHNLAAAGWVQYENAEEGLAIICEKAWDGKAAEAGVIDRDHYRYIIGAFASGALDGNYHGPDDSFNLATRLSTISGLSTKLKQNKEINLAEAESKARSAVFEHVFRFYRGMPDGLVMIKDIIYLDGANQLVKFLNQTDRPIAEVLDEFGRGKYNPFIPLQAKAMDGLYA
ncbi:MAG TPA: hypothetical protein VFP35_00630 [Candidatus Saccharimonadales bacterium]|nr:hypothetical protein [Candidatus Saccharimonadales bacterium]